MQEEITQKTFALIIRTSKLTEGVLEQAIKNYLQAQKQRQTQPKRGKQSVKELIGQNAGVSNLEITSGTFRCFEQVARKYRVDFAVKKDRTIEPPKYLIFFKGRDADVFTQVFKEFIKENEKRKNRVSVRKKLKQIKQVMGKETNRERVKEQENDRGLLR